MTIEQAIKIIKQVCANTQANLATHQQIQEAIRVVEEAMKKK